MGRSTRLVVARLLVLTGAAAAIGCVNPRDQALSIETEAGVDDGQGGTGGTGGSGARGGRQPGGPVTGGGGAGDEAPASLPDAGADAPPRSDTRSAPPDAPAVPRPDAMAAPSPDAPPADPGCDGDQHRCSGGCFSNSDPDHCGADCQACPTPSGGKAVCNAGSCDVTCDGGYHACGSACYSDSDAAHCGATCDTCPAAANATAVCRNGRCDATCNSGTMACGGSPPECIVPAWSFESGGTMGWSLVTGTGQHTAGGAVYVSTARAHGGSHALASDVSVNFAQEAYVVSIAVTLCGSGGVDLGGRTISMWAYFDGPAVDNRVISDPYVYTTGGTSYDPLSFGGQKPRTPLSNQWFEIKAVVPASEDHVVYKMSFFTNLNIDRWTGTIYLDDITLK